MKVKSLDAYYLTENNTVADSVRTSMRRRRLTLPFEKCKQASEKKLKGIEYVSIIKRNTNKKLFLFFHSRIKFNIRLWKLD